mgnify:CR=1 FL=1
MEKRSFRERRGRSVRHDLSQIDDALLGDGFVDGIPDGDGRETVSGVGKDVVGAIGIDAEEDILLNTGVTAAVSADTRFDRETLPGPEDGIRYPFFWGTGTRWILRRPTLRLRSVHGCR